MFKTKIYFLTAAFVATAAAASWTGLAQATISDGSNATTVLGQHTSSGTGLAPYYDGNEVNGAPNGLGLYQPTDVELDLTNQRLYVVDAFHNRILVYLTDASGVPLDFYPDYVLGQTDFNVWAHAGGTSGLGHPHGAAIDIAGQRLFVADSDNNRVLVYDVSTITNGEAAVSVLGQTDFTNSGAALTQTGMDVPFGVDYDPTGNRLFVVDGHNGRILVYDVASITNGEAAVNVLGQTNFTTEASGLSSSKFNGMMYTAFDDANDRLFVVDSSNNRILVFDLATVTDGEAAVNVLGQANFTSNAAATTQSGLNWPRGLSYDSSNGRLFVSDAHNDRVMVFDVAAITDGEAAVNVLGQTVFTSNSAGLSSSKFDFPHGSVFNPAANQLILSVYSQHRVMFFDTAAITDGEAAVNLIGQPDGDTSSWAQSYTLGIGGNVPNGLGYSGLAAMHIDPVNHRLYIGDKDNNRVLVHFLNADNTLVDLIPDRVIGQPDFHTTAAAVTATGLTAPHDVYVDTANQRLFVADSGADRVMVYDVSTITNGEAAVNVLGFSNMTSGTGGCSQTTMDWPNGLAYDPANGYLYVSGVFTSRVMVFDVTAITDGEAAVNVIGQPNFTTCTDGNGSSGLTDPYYIDIDASSQTLAVADRGNNRVLLFDVSAVTDGEAAVNVIGQPNFTTYTAATTASGLSGPRGMIFDPTNDRLIVFDSTNNRVLLYDISTVTNGEAAVNVLGQPDFTSATQAVSQSGMFIPVDGAYDAANGLLWVVDAGNTRITRYDAAPTALNPVPTLTSVSPTSKTAGEAQFSLTVSGSGFINGSIVRWNGADRATGYVSSSQLTATVTAADIAAAGTNSVTVFTPAPGGGASGAQSFTVNNPVPATSSVSPTAAVRGGSGFSLTVNGSNFVSGSTVAWGGADRATGFVSSSQLTATIPASDLLAAGTFSVTVGNPAPGGGTSGAQTFTVNNPVPATSSVSPSSKMLNDAQFDLTVNGSDFVSGSVVRWDGADRATAFVSAGQLTATIPATDLDAAGSFSVTVWNPGPGGGTSASQAFTVNNPVPATSSVSPSSKMLNDAQFDLTVNGSDFVSGAVVRMNGADRATGFVSSSQLTATIPAGDMTAAGSFSVTVWNPGPGGGTSGAQAFTVNNPNSTLSGLSPSGKLIDSAQFDLTVNGSDFVSGSVVRWDGADRATAFVSAGQLTATIPATDLDAAGTFSVTVFNPGPGGGTSASQAFTVSNPAPTTSGLSPDSKLLDEAGFELTVSGGSFRPDSVVRFGGSNRTTVYDSASQLRAIIPATDLDAAGTFDVDVVTPGPGGGTSGAQAFTVNNPVPVITGLIPDNDLLNAAEFEITVNGSNFLPISVVRWDGSNRTTVYDSASQLRAIIPATDLDTAGTFDVTVFNSGPGGGSSGSSTFTVNNPGPAIGALTPDTKFDSEGDFTLTVDGSGFVAGSVVRWSGADLPTAYVSGSQLTADVAQGDIASSGDVPVTVFSPGPGGGTSAAASFTVYPSASPQPPCPDPSVFISAPNGGEVFLASQQLNVFWGAQGCSLSGVRISYSTDSGASYPNEMATVGDATLGYYAWTVPTGLDSDSFRVRVELLGGGGTLASASSSADLTVGNPTQPDPELIPEEQPENQPDDQPLSEAPEEPTVVELEIPPVPEVRKEDVVEFENLSETIDVEAIQNEAAQALDELAELPIPPIVPEVDLAEGEGQQPDPEAQRQIEAQQEAQAKVVEALDSFRAATEEYHEQAAETAVMLNRQEQDMRQVEVVDQTVEKTLDVNKFVTDHALAQAESIAGELAEQAAAEELARQLAEAEAARLELERKEAEWKAAQEELARQAEEAAKKAKELQALDDESVLLAGIILTDTQKAASAELALANARQKVVQVANDLEQARAALEQHKADYRQASSEFSRLGNEIRLAQAALDRLNPALTASKEIYEQTIAAKAQLESEIAGLQEAIAGNQATLDQIIAERANLSRTVRTNTDGIANMRYLKSTMNCFWNWWDCFMIDQQVGRLEEDNRNHSARIGQIDGQKAGLEAALAADRGQLASKQADLAKIDLPAMAGAISQMETEISRLQGELSRNRDGLSRAGKQMNEVRSLRRETENDIRALEASQVTAKHMVGIREQEMIEAQLTLLDVKMIQQNKLAMAASMRGEAFVAQNDLVAQAEALQARQAELSAAVNANQEASATLSTTVKRVSPSAGDPASKAMDTLRERSPEFAAKLDQCGQELQRQFINILASAAGSNFEQAGNVFDSISACKELALSKTEKFTVISDLLLGPGNPISNTIGQVGAYIDDLGNVVGEHGEDLGSGLAVGLLTGDFSYLLNESGDTLNDVMEYATDEIFTDVVLGAFDVAAQIDASLKNPGKTVNDAVNAVGETVAGAVFTVVSWFS